MGAPLLPMRELPDAPPEKRPSPPGSFTRSEPERPPVIPREARASRAASAALRLEPKFGLPLVMVLRGAEPDREPTEVRAEATPEFRVGVRPETPEVTGRVIVLLPRATDAGRLRWTLLGSGARKVLRWSMFCAPRLSATKERVVVRDRLVG